MEGREGKRRGLLVFVGVFCVGADGVDVCQDDVGAGGVFLEMVILAIEA